MNGQRAAAVLLVAGWLALGDGAPAQPRETPAQIRRIVAQSLCLAVAYPESAMARDAESIYAVYATISGARDPLAARKKTEALAAADNPAKPTPVGGHNLALANAPCLPTAPTYKRGGSRRRGAQLVNSLQRSRATIDLTFSCSISTRASSSTRSRSF